MELQNETRRLLDEAGSKKAFFWELTVLFPDDFDLEVGLDSAGSCSLKGGAMKSKKWGIIIVVVGLLALVAISVVKRNQHCKMERDVVEFRIFPVQSPLSTLE